MGVIGLSRLVEGPLDGKIAGNTADVVKEAIALTLKLSGGIYTQLGASLVVSTLN